MNHRTKHLTIKKGNPQPLGITRCPKGVHFALEVPKNQNAELVLVSKENGEELPLEVIRQNGSLSIKVPEIAPWEIATVFAY